MYHRRHQISSWNAKEEKGKRSNRHFYYKLVIIYMIILVLLFLFFFALQIIMKKQTTENKVLVTSVYIERKEGNELISSHKATVQGERLAKILYKEIEQESSLKEVKEETEEIEAKEEIEVKEETEESNQIEKLEKIMYLTFDDGPHKSNTDKVLDILNKKNVKATFFLIGEYVEKNPEVVKRIVAEGHGIGVHCYRHDYQKLYGRVEDYIEDFEKAHEVIEEITGVDTKIFRFPGGSINDFNSHVREGIIGEMTKRGYVYYDWNASLEDAVKNPQGKELIQNAVSSTMGRKKVIMLAHDTVHETVECLEELLDHFPEYQMELLTLDMEPIQF